MKNKVFGVIFIIMTLIIIGLTSLVVIFSDSYHYWKRRSEIWKSRAGFEKRNNEKAAKELIKLAVQCTIPPVTTFQELNNEVHNMDDISKKLKEDSYTKWLNSQKKQTL